MTIDEKTTDELISFPLKIVKLRLEQHQVSVEHALAQHPDHAKEFLQGEFKGIQHGIDIITDALRPITSGDEE